MHVVAVSVCVVALALGSCTHVSPLRMEQDRFHYANALGDAREVQALLNIVKIRYADFPTFLDLTQVVTNYEMTDQLVSGGAVPINIAEGETKSANASAIYTTSVVESPSMIYRPISGPALVSKMLAPSSIEVVLGLVQTGWPIDSLMTALAFSANGKANRELQGLTVRAADIEFLTFLHAARRAQMENALTIRFELPTAQAVSERLGDIAAATSAPTSVERRVALAHLEPSTLTTRICFKTSRLSDEARSLLGEMRTALTLGSQNECYKVIAADSAPDEKTIALQMRSLFQVMQELAAYVAVPEVDLISGAAPRLALSEDSGGSDRPRLLNVHSGAAPPETAQVAIEYSGNWFWIDRNDSQSKSTFIFLILVLSITESGGSGAQLVVSAN
jgi:hypothetical protein